uniref:(northern house mosquito) hypothetical protein n=1 Tax=Culex pipiens TaxID=7175 RepID=A0A8D8EVF9_CULPI
MQKQKTYIPPPTNVAPSGLPKTKNEMFVQPSLYLPESGWGKICWRRKFFLCFCILRHSGNWIATFASWKSGQSILPDHFGKIDISSSWQKWTTTTPGPSEKKKQICHFHQLENG